MFSVVNRTLGSCLLPASTQNTEEKAQFVLFLMVKNLLC